MAATRGKKSPETLASETRVSETIEERVVPTIKPRALQWNYEGFCFRHGFVRLPEGFTLQDLNDEPEAWKLLQDNASTALRKFDQVRMVSYDEAWFVDATVSHAERGQVIFCGIKKTSMPDRSPALYQDETYCVEWAGSGYGIFRKADGVMMHGQTYDNAGAAKQALLSMYPVKKVA